jgi:hypothetical protein
MEPVRRALGTKQRIEYGSLLSLLEEDATALAGMFSAEQREFLGERVPRDPDHGHAIWSESDDPDAVAWKKNQLEHARRLAAQGLHDPDRLAAEIRD